MSLPAVAVVGAGYMGRLHAQKLALLDTEGLLSFVGVYDVVAESANAVAAEHGVTAFADMGALADATSAAILAVPTVEHGSMGLELLERGLDLLIEKPIASTREEAARLIETARARKRILQVGHVERFNAAVRKILPILQRPRFIEAHRIGPYPKRGTDVSVVLDLMIHDLDLVALLTGSDVRSIEAVGVPVLSTTEDIVNARVHFASGSILNITASRVSLEPLRKIRMFQKDSYISLDFGAKEIVFVRREGEPGGEVEPKLHLERLALDPGDALLAQARSFAETIQERKDPEVSGEDGYRALDLALQIQAKVTPFEDCE